MEMLLLLLVLAFVLWGTVLCGERHVGKTRQGTKHEEIIRQAHRETEDMLKRS